jgi:1-deoxy-D-xylulose-5-phosphate reductoisomerase
VCEDHFPALRLGIEAGRAGGAAPAVFNAANEQAVAAFHAHRLPFLGIVDTVRRVVESHEAPGLLTRETLAEAERWARREADRHIATP